MQTRNGNLIITDQIRKTEHARHLGTTTVQGVLRQQLGGLRRRAHAKEAGACEQSRLSMVVDESAYLGVEQAQAGARGGVRRAGVGHTPRRKSVVAGSISNQQRALCGWDTWTRVLKTKGKKAEEQTIDYVQLGKIVGRIGRRRGRSTGVVPGAGEISAGVGGSRGIKRTGQTIQWGVRKVATAKHGQDCSICRSCLQVPLSAEWEGFLRPVESFFLLNSF
jgi:hypothetical protein